MKKILIALLMVAFLGGISFAADVDKDNTTPPKAKKTAVSKKAAKKAKKAAKKEAIAEKKTDVKEANAEKKDAMKDVKA